MIATLHPFIVAGHQVGSKYLMSRRFSTDSSFQMAATYAPDCYFNLPICDQTTSLPPHCSGPQPSVTEIIHYSHKLRLAVPLATSAAALITTVRTEELQDLGRFPEAARSMPHDRASADALGMSGPTFEDISSFHFQERIHVPHRNVPVADLGFDQYNSDAEDEDKSSPLPKCSERYDEDWSRLVACHHPWMGPTALRGKMFTPGSLVGSWEGRMLVKSSYVLRSLITLLTT